MDIRLKHPPDTAITSYTIVSMDLEGGTQTRPPSFVLSVGQWRRRLHKAYIPPADRAKHQVVFSIADSQPSSGPSHRDQRRCRYSFLSNQRKLDRDWACCNTSPCICRCAHRDTTAFAQQAQPSGNSFPAFTIADRRGDKVTTTTPTLYIHRHNSHRLEGCKA